MEKKNLADKRAELRNKERELQDMEEKHQVSIWYASVVAAALGADVQSRCFDLQRLHPRSVHSECRAAGPTDRLANAQSHCPMVAAASIPVLCSARNLKASTGIYRHGDSYDITPICRHSRGVDPKLALVNRPPEQVEIKIYKQRVKHLLYEQQDDVTAKKMSAEVSLKLAQV